MSQWICVFDLCDGKSMKDYWADWNCETGEIVFGGYWTNVPSYISRTEPSEEEIWNYASQYDPETGEKLPEIP